MPAIPVIAIFDIGKTNKKLLLFDQQYKVVHEQSARFAETKDEDSFPCENLESLSLWVNDSLKAIPPDLFSIKAMNFATYGASFVYIGDTGKSLTPLYNYLKPYPQKLQEEFYNKYGGEDLFSRLTASPVSGSLNSGMQLYRLKFEQPEIFRQVKYALHLPQYISYLFTSKCFSEITSIGCHTNLWNFETNEYHEWVYKERVLAKLPPIVSAKNTSHEKSETTQYVAGVGVHDSSASLVPYIVNSHEPFALLSTGTWCVTLNPFNTNPLTESELRNDCLSYINYKGEPVKASKLFSGNEYDEQIKRIREHYHKESSFFEIIKFDEELARRLITNELRNPAIQYDKTYFKISPFNSRDLSMYSSVSEAYHQLMIDLVQQQYISTELVTRGTPVKKVFVDGGFSKNNVYMNVLASRFQDVKIYAASLSQGTALGAALVIHEAWNTEDIPANIIDLKYYRPAIIYDRS